VRNEEGQNGIWQHKTNPGRGFFQEPGSYDAFSSACYARPAMRRVPGSQESVSHPNRSTNAMHLLLPALSLRSGALTAAPHQVALSARRLTVG
jgi:hypothetical protein